MDISDIRREIDRVDNALLSLIAERLALSAEVKKAKSGSRLWRPSREQALVRELSQKAEDTPITLVSRIWAELVSASLSLQGPMRLHVSLVGDSLEIQTLVRDRFGAALPIQSYPIASAALAAAYGEDEGVAVLPAPGGRQTWWVALCDGGALSDMQIHAGLPRMGDRDWPEAVAVATADLLPSGEDMTLIAVSNPNAFNGSGLSPVFRAEAGDFELVTIDGFIEDQSDVFDRIKAIDPRAKIIGALSRPLNGSSVKQRR